MLLVVNRRDDFLHYIGRTFHYQMFLREPRKHIRANFLRVSSFTDGLWDEDLKFKTRVFLQKYRHGSNTTLCYGRLNLKSISETTAGGHNISEAVDEVSEAQNEKERMLGLNGHYLVSGFGWRIREVNGKDQEDLMAVADIQATAFHTPSIAFDQFFLSLFKAEVLSALLYKVRNFLPHRYSCLVAEAEDAVCKSQICGIDNRKQLVGVVDLTALADKDTLLHLHGADEYLYVSGLAVAAECRRRNVATLLLQACNIRALEWGFTYLVLQANEDDIPARKLYLRSGFRAIAHDSMWFTSWLGKKRRIIMAKRVKGPETMVEQ